MNILLNLLLTLIIYCQSGILLACACVTAQIIFFSLHEHQVQKKWSTLLMYPLLFYIHINHISYNKHLISKDNTIQTHIFIKKITHQDHLHTSFLGQTPLGTLTISWYHADPKLSIHQSWNLLLHTKPLHYLKNTHFTPTRLWHVGTQTIGKASVIKSDINRLLSTHHTFIDRMRITLRSSITQFFTSSETQAFLDAILLGDHTLLSSSQWKTLTLTGTYHMLAVAGLHIMSIFNFMYIASYSIVSFISPYTRRYPIQYISTLIGLLFSALYALIASGSLPSQRALFMLLIFSFCKFTTQNFVTEHKAYFAALLIIALNPLIIYLPSFWLSFLSIWALQDVHANSHLNIKTLLCIQWRLFIIMLPLSVTFFNEITLLGFIANLVVVPVLCLLIIPLTFCFACVSAMSGFLTHLISLPLSFIISTTWSFLTILASSGSGYTACVAYNKQILISTYIGSIWLIHPYFNQTRHWALFCYLPLILPPVSPPPPGKVNLTVLDVGQGLAVIVHTTKHTLIYDTGPSFLSSFNAGRDVVYPELIRTQTSHIDSIIVSHSDNDHSGGLHFLISHLPTHHILSSDTSLLPKGKIQPCYAGQHWLWDNVSFKMIWPRQGVPYLGNNSSCVLQILTNSSRILLTGDIEKESEKKILKRYPKLKNDVLIVPHHGSCSSSSPAFIHAVQPNLAVFSLGYHNTYHFPCQKVVQRYLSEGTSIYLTCKQGQLTQNL